MAAPPGRFAARRLDRPARSRVAALAATSTPAGSSAELDPGSFRDPSGQVFRRDGHLYRQIQAAGEADWRAFNERGLYRSMAADGLIVQHDPAPLEMAAAPGAVDVIRPHEVRAVSYPYEWCFSQLREAALLTLELQRRALAVGMRLKDASAYNVQFDRGRPIIIDSLSFEVAEATAPWPAYRQFCEHFLGPLALMAYRDPRLGLLLRDFIDGVPLDLVATLLPARSRLRMGLLAHIHVHAGAQRRAARNGPPARAGAGRVSETGQLALLDSLRRTVEGLRWRPGGHWIGYGTKTSYTDQGAAAKRAEVERMLARVPDARLVWDLGANQGTYSDAAAADGRVVLAFDQDAATVERHWHALSGATRASVLPLVLDLTNPSPALGWGLAERRSLVERGPADLVMALALAHHLAIGNNVPLPRIASFLAKVARSLIIEFVPKEDPMTQRLLAARQDVFPDYTIDAFRSALGAPFRIVAEVPIQDSLRTLFFMERRT